jgi:CRP-like cAMP-binding protein
MDPRELKEKATQFFAKGKFAKAAETYADYCKADPKDTQARLRMGDAWAKAGQKDRAVAAYQSAAEGFAKEGFLPRAIAASKLILELDPAHKGVQQMLADLYARKSGAARPPVSARPLDGPAPARHAPLELDGPPAPAKPGHRHEPIEVPELDAPGVVQPPTPVVGPSPLTRKDAIEIEEEPAVPSGPSPLSPTGIDIELSAGAPVTGEIEIPIEGTELSAEFAPRASAPVAEIVAGEEIIEGVEMPAPPPARPERLELDAPLAPPAPTPFALDEPLAPPRPAPATFELDAPFVPPAPPRPAPATFELDAPFAPPAPPRPAPATFELDAPLEPPVPPRPAPATFELDAPLVPPAPRRPPAPATFALDAPPAPATLARDTTVAPRAPTRSASPSTFELDALPPEAPVAPRAPIAPATVEARPVTPLAPAASAQPPVAASASGVHAPPGLRRKAEPPLEAAPQSSPLGARIWLPPTFAPPVAAPSAVVPSAPRAASPVEASELERSLSTFSAFDVDAPAAAPAPAAALVTAAALSSFTELDLDGDSLLHAVEAAAAHAPTTEPTPEESLEAPEEPRLGGLPKIPLFSDLPEDAFIALFEQCPLRRVEQGQFVFHQGDAGSSFFVLCSGAVRVLRTDDGQQRELATLEEGSFFGEMALLSDAPRTASVEATQEDTQLLEITGAVLSSLSARYPSVATALKKFYRQRLLSNLMATSRLFHPFSRSDRRDLVQRFRAREVNRGDVLVREGAPSDGLYLILSGEIDVQTQGRKVARLKEGDMFGEMSLLTRAPATASCVAARRTSLLRLPHEDFNQLIMSHPQILELVAELTDQRRSANTKPSGTMI